ncbi:hypothetical protein PHMEG_0005695 [Phytophthora megakarya]|uniref:Reverse transcriptase domain-containing protein n=1 Tax=Phytophthora megakarya TaxID=4795 RepID=A0A225WQZ0_9STRA|nr:hypothetical protein PHMEG_0005695 [Phytophthora megakarya]
MTTYPYHTRCRQVPLQPPKWLLQEPQWLCTWVQTYRETIHVLNIDFSRAFDTIDCVKLLDILQ